MPSLQKVDLRCASQLKDEVIEYMLDHNRHIQHLQLDSANLVSDDIWRRFMEEMGPQLLTLKLSFLDSSFDDGSVKQLASNCDKLQRLKLTDCWKPGDESLKAIATMTSLEHLSLDLLEETSGEIVAQMVESVGSKLQTLSLKRFREADDLTLSAIHNTCRKLNKLRISDNVVCTDKGYKALFTGWQNPSLSLIDFSGAQDLDYTQPDGPEDPIGLASEGFKALMAHSGSSIQHLNISSCRHITHAAFSNVFNADKQYPALKTMDVSLMTALDDYLVNCIFKSCPALKKLTAFSCFNVRDVRVPRNVVLIGGLTSHDTIELEGNFAGPLPDLHNPSGPYSLH